MKLTSEVLSAARTIHCFAWQAAFQDRIAHLRKVETKTIYKAQRLKAFGAGVYFATTPLAVPTPALTTPKAFS